MKCDEDITKILGTISCVYANEFGVLYIHGTLERDFNLAVRQIFLNRPTKITAKYSLFVTHHLSNTIYTVEPLYNRHFRTRHFLPFLQYRGFSLTEVKNVLVTLFGAKIFVLIMEVFSIVSLIRRV